MTPNLQKSLVKEGLDLHLKQNLPKEPTRKLQRPRKRQNLHKRQVKEKPTLKGTAAAAVERMATEPVTAKIQLTRAELEEPHLWLDLAQVARALGTQILKIMEPGAAVQVMEIRVTVTLDLDLALPGVDLAPEILARAQALVQETAALAPELQTPEAVVAARAQATPDLAQVQEQVAQDLARETGN